MVWLLAGLLVFLGVHSLRIVAPGWRDARVAAMGPMAFKGVYSLVSIAGFVLLVWGYAQARADAPVLLVNDRQMLSFMSHERLDELIDTLSAKASA